MCNSEDRQNLIQKVHKPDFYPQKYTFECNHPDKNLRSTLYSMDLSKPNFVEVQPQLEIVDLLN